MPDSLSLAFCPLCLELCWLTVSLTDSFTRLSAHIQPSTIHPCTPARHCKQLNCPFGHMLGLVHFTLIPFIFNFFFSLSLSQVLLSLSLSSSAAVSPSILQSRTCSETTLQLAHLTCSPCLFLALSVLMFLLECRLVADSSARWSSHFSTISTGTCWCRQSRPTSRWAVGEEM